MGVAYGKVSGEIPPPGGIRGVLRLDCGTKLRLDHSFMPAIFTPAVDMRAALQMAGLAALAALAPGMLVSHAASPHAQFESGVPLEQIRCGDGLVLLGSPRGTPACATAATSERLQDRGFARIHAVDITGTDPGIRPAGVLQADVTDAVSASNAFATSFYRQVSGDHENVFFSPLGIYAAFSALYEGARGETAAQMRDVFGFEPDPERRLTGMAGLLEWLNRPGRHVELDVANSLWTAEDFPPRESYVSVVRDGYSAHVESLDLAAEGEGRINGWAGDATRGRISDVVTADDLAGAVTVLVNSVYFNGNWSIPFYSGETRPGPFITEDGQVLLADLMSVKDDFGYAESGGARVLKMPFEGGGTSMMVVLPGDGIKELGESLTPGMIREWDGMLETREVSVTLPKFTLTSGYDLRGYLEEAGMPDVFDPAAADLSGIADAGPLNIYVTKAAHDTFLDVHEKGTEAAATTTIVSSLVGLPDPPVYFAADRPFIFAILDDASGVILFMGRLSEPPAFGDADPDIDYYHFIEPPPQLSTANKTVLLHPVPDSYSGENVAVIPLGAASMDCSRTGICFVPPEATIQRGEALTWFNADAIDHLPGLYINLDSDPEHAHYSYMEPGDSHSHVFEEPGRYMVICALHPWMVGEVIVE